MLPESSLAGSRWGVSDPAATTSRSCGKISRATLSVWRESLGRFVTKKGEGELNTKDLTLKTKKNKPAGLWCFRFSGSRCFQCRWTAFFRLTPCPPRIAEIRVPRAHLEAASLTPFFWTIQNLRQLYKNIPKTRCTKLKIYEVYDYDRSFPQIVLLNALSQAWISIKMYTLQYAFFLYTLVWKVMV